MEKAADGLQPLGRRRDRRANKPRGISIEVEATQIQTRATYSVDDVVALEEEHRTAFTDGSTLAIHFLFLDGAFAENPDVLGFAC